MFKFNVGDVVRWTSRKFVGTIVSTMSGYPRSYWAIFSGDQIGVWEYELELVSDNKICWQREGF